MIWFTFLFSSYTSLCLQKTLCFSLILLYNETYNHANVFHCAETLFADTCQKYLKTFIMNSATLGKTRTIIDVGSMKTVYPTPEKGGAYYGRKQKNRQARQNFTDRGVSAKRRALSIPVQKFRWKKTMRLRYDAVWLARKGETNPKRLTRRNPQRGLQKNNCKRLSGDVL